MSFWLILVQCQHLVFEALTCPFQLRLMCLNALACVSIRRRARPCTSMHVHASFSGTLNITNFLNFWYRSGTSNIRKLIWCWSQNRHRDFRTIVLYGTNPFQYNWTV